MKHISVILSTTVLFLITSLSVFFNACTKDPCKDIICKNNGVCRDGRCRCATGFEGPNCEKKMNEKMVGTWDGTYRCNGLVPKVTTLIIAPGAAPNEINIYNIFNQNEVIAATINTEETNLLTIPYQNIGDITVHGQGYVESNYITIAIDEKDNTNGNFFSCVYNGTKFVNP
ncbi:MAG: calcium-binding EGF-like domain-containing protein [Chitinophagaceae bacterium]